MVKTQSNPLLATIQALSFGYFTVRSFFSTIQLSQSIITYKDNIEFLKHGVSIPNSTFTDNWYNNDWYKSAFSINAARAISITKKAATIHCSPSFFSTAALFAEIGIAAHVVGIALDVILPKYAPESNTASIHYFPELVLSPGLSCIETITKAQTFADFFNTLYISITLNTPNFLFFLNEEYKEEFKQELLGEKEL